MIDPEARLRRVLLPEEASGDPLDAIARAPGEPAFYWRSDAAGIEIAGLGAARVIETSGPDRFRDAGLALARLRDELGCENPDWPLLVGGFAFGDDAADEGARNGSAQPRSDCWRHFPPLRFFLPRVLWIRRDGSRRLVVTYPAGREQTPMSLLDDGDAAHDDSRGDNADNGDARGDAQWFDRVSQAQQRIRSGGLDKAVLARRRTLETGPCARVEEIVAALAHDRPHCFTFLVRWRGRSFFGSSPERLARVRRGVLDADALAGSAPRGRGKAEDDAGVRDLLANDKERREHRIVVDAIAEALRPVASDIAMDEVPSVMRLPESLHLHTPIRATLSRPVSLLEAAGRLHPTPAVCGAPRARAQELLEAEAADRGWYSGGVGWMSADGDGELAVSLRAALLEEGLAHVWAGAGIVEGSDARLEFEETERKMRSILPYLPPYLPSPAQPPCPAPAETERDVCAA